MGYRKGQVEVTSHFDLEGPFFTKDVRKTVIENIGDMLDRAAEAMEQDVRDSIAGHAGSMPYYDGWSWARTIGRRKSGRGKEWWYHAVVSANTEGGDPRVGKLDKRDAIRTKAAAVTIEKRWHPYRKASSAARRAIKTLDLTKGLG
jgi:hypothetical protein